MFLNERVLIEYIRVINKMLMANKVNLRLLGGSSSSNSSKKDLDKIKETDD